VALVGYTNAGKSTVLNRLTGSEHPANDRLFDNPGHHHPAAVAPGLGGRVSAQRHGGLYPQAGHIHLIEAFKARWRSCRYADLLLHVIDVSAPDWEEQAAVTDVLIRSLGAEQTPILRVYNKCDAIAPLTELPRSRDGVCVSARTGEGMDDLLSRITKELMP
jgi:GTP-binding protein HflX